MAAVIAPGCRVRLHYRLASGEGFEVDSSAGEEPLALTLGDGTLHPNLEQALIGLSEGERVRLLLGPEQAFGWRDEEQLQRLERSEFPPDLALAPGHVLEFTTPGGFELPGRVVELEAEWVLIDFNHPLAGLPVVFEVEILAVECG